MSDSIEIKMQVPESFLSLFQDANAHCQDYSNTRDAESLDVVIHSWERILERVDFRTAPQSFREFVFVQVARYYLERHGIGRRRYSPIVSRASTLAISTEPPAWTAVA